MGMVIATVAQPALNSITALTAVITVLWTGLLFLMKYQFSQMNKNIDTNQSKISETQRENQNELSNFRKEITKTFSESNEKVNGRIDRIQQELNDVKGDFATTFVLREDFFRAMNGVEDNIRETGRKVDKILMLMGEKQKGE